MSFAKRRQLIEEGDVVILYLGINRMLKLDVIQHTLSKKNQVIENVVQTQYGAIKPYSLVGKPFGSKVQLTKGWGHILCPTPELWTHVVPHRTQILYAPDISFILMNLEIQPGSIVIEAGTGSGSLSHAFINAIKTKGHLYTFDFHEIRAKTAREEFHQHGLGEWVSVDHRDVGAEGFGEKLLQKADAVFLDLPNPWNVIEHALVSLKLGGRICTFSPCVEQVQRTVQKLNKLGFEEVTTVEIIQTEKGVHRRMNNTLDLNIVKVERIDEEVQRSSTARNRAPAASEVNGKSGSGTGISNTVTSNPSSQTGHSGYLTFGLVGDRALMEATNILFREFKNARPTPPTEIFDDGHTSFQDFIKKTNETQFPNI